MYALTYAEFQVHPILTFSTALMWISEDAAKTLVRAETWKRVSVLRASFLSFILKCSFARKHFWEASGIARLQSKYNLGNKRRDVQTEFLRQIHRSRCGRQTTKLPWIYDGLFAALSLIAFSQTSLENLADWLKFKLISLIKRRQKSSCNWGKYWKKN